MNWISLSEMVDAAHREARAELQAERTEIEQATLAKYEAVRLRQRIKGLQFCLCGAAFYGAVMTAIAACAAFGKR